MWIVLMCVIVLATARGFLLDLDHTPTPAGKNQCLPLGTYLSDKEDLRHQMNELKSQLQVQLSAIKGKISEYDRKNETFEILDKNYQELGINYTLLQQENKLLRDKYSYLENAIKRLQNTTAETSKNVSELYQLKSINQALDFRAIQTKVVTLEHKSNLLTNNQNAQNQVFLTLYNVTQVTDNLFKKHLQSFESNRNETLEKLFNIESKQNASSFEMRNAFSNITTLDSQVADNRKKVAVTACVSLTQQFSDYIVKFSTVNFYIGINNINAFRSSGQFVCEIPGLYYISAHIYTITQNYSFSVLKNGIEIASSVSDLDSTFSASPISAVVELQPRDTLYVYSTHLVVHNRYSCLSIMKVK